MEKRPKPVRSLGSVEIRKIGLYGVRSSWQEEGGLATKTSYWGRRMSQMICANGENRRRREEGGNQVKKLNEEAFEDLLLAMPGDTEKGRIAFTMVRKSKTTELANGDAELAWKDLKTKFE